MIIELVKIKGAKICWTRYWIMVFLLQF